MKVPFFSVVSLLSFVLCVFGQKSDECTAESDGQCYDPTRADVRSKLVFPKEGLMPGKPFPRVHVDDLYKPENEDYLYRRKTFILTGAADDWKAVSEKFLQGGRRLAKWFPRTVVDFYPMNMLKTGSHPYLFRMKGGYEELLLEPGKGRFGEDEVKNSRGKMAGLMTCYCF